jgi:hypothetical protein
MDTVGHIEGNLCMLGREFHFLQRLHLTENMIITCYKSVSYAFYVPMCLKLFALPMQL